MASLNRVFLMGNLTRDPQLKYTPGGLAVCELGLAVNRKFKKGDEWVEETCFVDITAFGRQAETSSEYLAKGRPVLIEGRLKFDSWTNQEGQKRSKLTVVADRVQFLGAPSGSGQAAGGSERPPSGAGGQGSQGGQGPDDNIPF